MSEDFITLADAQRAGYCVKGMRDYLEAKGIDFRQVVKDRGVSVSKLNADDAVIQHIVNVRDGRV